MKPRCKPNQHTDRPLKRGSTRVQCATCGDVYPCRHACDHVDCILATGRALPDWLDVTTAVESEAPRD